jgi:hypothetical protein
MKPVNKRHQALATASQAKRTQAIERTEQALKLMQQDNIPINFESVANMAGVSKVWLYGQKEISSVIKASRDKSEIAHKNADAKRLLKARTAEVEKLKLRVKEQEDLIKKLKAQLEVVYGELYKKNNAD